jgi:hypothetical protein
MDHHGSETMRVSTVLSAATLTLSAAALAQVATTPAEQKVPQGNATPGNDMVMTDNSLAGPPDATGAPASSAPANDTAPMTEAPDGDPTSPTAAPRKR